jgi:predicted MFS family arabinose efflux permease
VANGETLAVGRDPSGAAVVARIQIEDRPTVRPRGPGRRRLSSRSMKPQRSTALRFVLLLGVVNLFADLTYEGGRSITGPFLAQLGATAAMVSIISGVGEFFGYTLRAGAGYLADKTKRYWPLVIAGYVINLFAVPALALAGHWYVAAALIAAERTGRAIRRPIVQGMLSHVKDDVGGGRAFGINESLDALGATVGPLVVAFAIARSGNYRLGFAVLLVSAVISLLLLLAVRRQHPDPRAFEQTSVQHGKKPFSREFWIYVAGGSLIGFGFIDFSLIAFHFEKTNTLRDGLIPVSYALAMGTGAVGNYLLGRWYDRVGTVVLLMSFSLGAIFVPLVFFGSSAFAWLGMALWGLNKGAQDTLFKPAIAPLIDADRRTTAFGVFDTCFGVAWLAGSVAFGLLYDKSLTALVTISVVTQLLSLPLFIVARTFRDGNRR